jgi:diphosphomevalonate decarboxylase
MSIHIATAIAFPNIAFIKYWGDRDPALHLPDNGSISMNLAGLITRTQVSFDPSLPADRLSLNGQPVYGQALHRVSALLKRVRSMAGLTAPAAVTSENNFPTGAGVASSASAFAALSLAASAAAGLALDEPALSRLARTGSGSACRSVPAGFVEWRPGENHEDSFAVSIAPPQHWDLVDCIAIVSQIHKPTGSAVGHTLAATSPLHTARVQHIPALLNTCRGAILAKDFDALAAVTELDCNLMHAVMMTSTPPLHYWQAGTLEVIHAVQDWRKRGLPVCYTIDAGPNVHVLCAAEIENWVVGQLRDVSGVQQVVTAHAGGAASLELR